MQIRLRATLADQAAAASTVTEVRDQLTCCARSRDTMSPTGCLPSRSFIEYGVDGFGGFPDFYRNDVPKIFAEVQDSALQSGSAAMPRPAARRNRGQLHEDLAAQPPLKQRAR